MRPTSETDGTDARGVIGAILCGGASARFGGKPKGLETVGEIRLIDRVAAALRDVVSDLMLVSSARDAAGWLPGVRACGDVWAGQGRGSLIGIHAALTHARGPVLVVAWDMPFVSRELLSAIRSRADGTEERQRGTARTTCAVFAESDSGLEACCAWYAPAALPIIESMLETGERRLGALADRLPAWEKISREDVARIGAPERLFFNVNRPEDLARANEMLGRDAAGSV